MSAVKIQCVSCNKRYSGEATRISSISACPRCRQAGDWWVRLSVAETASPPVSDRNDVTSGRSSLPSPVQLPGPATTASTSVREVPARQGRYVNNSFLEKLLLPRLNISFRESFFIPRPGFPTGLLVMGSLLHFFGLFPFLFGRSLGAGPILFALVFAIAGLTCYGLAGWVYSRTTGHGSPWRKRPTGAYYDEMLSSDLASFTEQAYLDCGVSKESLTGEPLFVVGIEHPGGGHFPQNRYKRAQAKDDGLYRFNATQLFCALLTENHLSYAVYYWDWAAQAVATKHVGEVYYQDVVQVLVRTEPSPIRSLVQTTFGLQLSSGESIQVAVPGDRTLSSFSVGPGEIEGRARNLRAMIRSKKSGDTGHSRARSDPYAE